MARYIARPNDMAVRKDAARFESARPSIWTGEGTARAVVVRLGVVVGDRSIEFDPE